ncbi:hypothetical protein FOH10_10070 [Nocardia otitidiscaviarum]|uniref:Uncharacterized protein n=1 Tax=Nocardia otitidiscaviarum TaxID=1823 RepID=A0A516NJE8_9NOCA|nr:hypothetical protein [Nocardia otitidiscaviarum]MCP9618884.1 hypothetical protein [Nocardia otitidiscaviarum]QDP79028.1 hypothetical protein FOH10_10070 [Nocardia otitidiscaviarum]
MRTPLHIAFASIAAATLVTTAAQAAAEPAPAPTPAITIADGTGSSALDSGSAAADSLALFAQQGNVIGILALLVAAPLHIMTGAICDMATLSALPSPCAPRVY